MLGRENHLPIDLVYGAPESGPLYQSDEDFVARRQQLFRESYRLVRDSLQRSAERRKQRYDLRVKGRHFAVGDKVYYFYPRRRMGVSPKWQQFYDGPYEVVEQLGPITYRIQKSPRARPVVTHVDKLKPCWSSGDGDIVCQVASRPNPVTHVDQADECLTPPDPGDGLEARKRPSRETRLPKRYQEDYFVRSVAVVEEKMHRCRQCGRDFPTYVWLKSHIKNSHRQAVCPTDLDTRTVVVQHQVVTGDPPTVAGVANSSEIAAGDPSEPATPPDVVTFVELRRALMASQFCYFRKNLTDTTECLYKWHIKDRDTLWTSTMDLVRRLRGTSAGAAMSQENLAAIVVSAKRFSHRAASAVPLPTAPPSTCQLESYPSLRRSSRHSRIHLPSGV